LDSVKRWCRATQLDDPPTSQRRIRIERSGRRRAEHTFVGDVLVNGLLEIASLVASPHGAHGTSAASSSSKTSLLAFPLPIRARSCKCGGGFHAARRAAARRRGTPQPPVQNLRLEPGDVLYLRDFAATPGIAYTDGLGNLNIGGVTFQVDEWSRKPIQHSARTTMRFRSPSCSQATAPRHHHHHLTYTDAGSIPQSFPDNFFTSIDYLTCFPVSRLARSCRLCQRPAIADVRIVLNSNFDIAQAAPTITPRRGTTSSWKARFRHAAHSAGGLFTFASGRSFIENARLDTTNGGIECTVGCDGVHR